MRKKVLVLWGVLLAAAPAVPHAASAQGPGDPTAPFADGFEQPCRLAVDSVGNLLVAELGLGELWKVDPGGNKTLYSTAVADPRWVAFDAFGWLLVSSRNDSKVYRISPQGEVTDFLELGDPVGIATRPDGSIWVGATDSLYHFDAMGRFISAIATVDTYGFAVRGLYPAPDGTLYLTGSAALWKLVDGGLLNLLADLPYRWWGLAFDASGNGYWAHEAIDEGDTDRVSQVDLAGAWLDEAWIEGVVDPCRVVFGRDPDGSTNSTLYIGQTDGTIVTAAAGSPLASGWPVEGLRLSDIDPGRAADEVMGVPGLLSDGERTFLDVIGNYDDSYDVGDFRAYLVAAGVVE
jgi:hypothetical protein